MRAKKGLPLELQVTLRRSVFVPFGVVVSNVDAPDSIRDISQAGTRIDGCIPNRA